MRLNFWDRAFSKLLAFVGLFLTVSLIAVPADAQTKVMALGDSLCHNNMQALRTKIAQSGLKVDWVGTMNDGPAPDPDNECHGGWQAAQVIGDKAPPPWIKADAPVLPAWVAVAKPQIALVMLGTNDIILGGKDTLLSSLHRIVDAIHKGAPGVHIVLASIPPITYEPAGGMVREINQKIPDLVRAKQAEGKKISFLNMHSKVPVTAISEDKVHLTDAGNQAIADAWLSALKLLLGSKNSFPPTATPTPVRQPTASPGQNRGSFTGYQKIIAKHSGKALDVFAHATTDGGAVVQWTYLGDANQQWKIESNGDGTYRIVSKLSGKVLDVGGASVLDGGVVHQWSWLSVDNQRWLIEPDVQGFYKIVAKHSGKVLEVGGAATADGAKVGQWADLGLDNQRWRIQPAGGSSTSPRRVKGAINSVATILSDMQGSHEGRLSGVPDSYDWAKRPRLGMGNKPGSFRALTAWGQIYREAGAAVPANTRIEIRNMKAYILHKSDNKWHKVQESVGVEGGAYVEDFAGDKSIAPDARKEPSGSVSVKLTPGYNYHFWPAAGRATFDPNDLAGVYVTYQARLILNNSSATDDRAQARFLAGAGGDYWLNATAQGNNFKTNGDFAIGKMKLVTKKWRTFNAITLSADQIRSAPPPIE